MCRIFAGQDPANYACHTRSVRLAGHVTSIRLEAKFWEILDEIAEEQGMTTPKFLSLLYDEVMEINPEMHNFASLLRVSCLNFALDRAGVMERAKGELAAAAAE